MLSKKIKQAMAGSSAIRAMFMEGKEMAARYGAENVYDFSLGNPAHFHRILFICLCARQQHNLYFLLLDNIILCALFLCNIAVLVCNISIAIWQHFSICMIRIYK